MIKKLDNKTAVKRWQLLFGYRTREYVQWLNQCKINERFYFGEQYTDEEIKKLKERGQYVIVMNRLRKAIRGIVGMMAANTPKYKVYPRNKDDYEIANLTNKLLEWAWDKSGGIHTFRKIIKYSVIDNMAYFYIFKDHDGIKFKFLPYNEVVIDPKSTDPLFRDADMIYVTKYIPLDMAKMIYGVDDISTEVPQAFYTDRDIVPVISDNFKIFLDRVFDKQKKYVKLFEIYRKVPIPKEDGSFDVKIKVETMIGYRHLFEQEFPDTITEYPIIPIYVEDTPNPYKYGEVQFLKELQKFVNKAYGITLLNAQLMSNPKVYLHENDIPNVDIEEWERKHAQPGSVNILNPGAEPPIIIQGQPINNAFFTLYQDAKIELEYNTLPSILLGQLNSENTKINPSIMLDLKDSVLDTYKDLNDNIQLACNQLGKVILQYCASYLTKEQILHITTSNKQRESITINQRINININDPRQIEQYKQYWLQKGKSETEIDREIEEARHNENLAKALYIIKNDVSLITDDVQIIPGSYNANYEIAQLRLMIELAQIGAVSPDEILHYLPIENKDELVNKYELIKQLQGQLEQYEQLIQQLQQETNKNQQEIINLKTNQVVLQEKIKQEKLNNEIKLKQYFNKKYAQLLNEKMRTQLSKEIAEILAVEKINSMKRQLKNQTTNEKDITEYLTEE